MIQHDIVEFLIGLVDNLAFGRGTRDKVLEFEFHNRCIPARFAEFSFGDQKQVAIHGDNIAGSGLQCIFIFFPDP